MKKVLLLAITALFLASCSTDDSPELGDFYFEYVPIENVVLPNQFQLGQTYTVEYSYFKPTTCHYFNDLYYDINESTRTVAIINTVETGTVGCFELSDEMETRTFNFSANENTTYLFRFWKGVDANEEDVYLEVEVPVNE